jgi:hypothetical protein
MSQRPEQTCEAPVVVRVPPPPLAVLAENVDAVTVRAPLFPMAPP